jgi:DNA-binding HxlR family transcriptional regulator
LQNATGSEVGVVRKDKRSGCPVNLSLEIFGDRWTLLVLRDVIFVGSRHFRELLAGPERISSNILADRLAVLVEHGLLTRTGDPSHKQKVTYSLTEQAIELVPVLVQLSAWGVRHLPVEEEYAARARVLSAGGPPLWETFMDELREVHLGPQARRRPAPAGPTVTERLQAAYTSAPASAGPEGTSGGR